MVSKNQYSDQPLKACFFILGYALFMSGLGYCIKVISKGLSFEMTLFFRRSSYLFFKNFCQPKPPGKGHNTLTRWPGASSVNLLQGLKKDFTYIPDLDPHFIFILSQVDQADGTGNDNILSHLSQFLHANT